MSMPCAICGAQSGVVDSRPHNGSIRRRRLCEYGHRWTTLEQPALEGVARTCAGCGLHFVALSSTAKWCSPTCRERVKRGLTPSAKVCLQCGSKFNTFHANRKFCSPACREASMHVPTVTRECAHCGRQFKSKYSIHTFCSNSCRQLAYVARKDAADATRLKRKKWLKCRQCSRTFARNPSGRLRKYCSLRCSKREYKQRAAQQRALRLKKKVRDSSAWTQTQMALEGPS